MPDRRTFLRSYVWPHRWLIALALLLNALHGFAITYQNLMPKWLISDVLKVEHYDVAEKLHHTGILMLVYLGVSIGGRMLMWHLGYRVFTAVRERILLRLRSDFFEHVNHLCLRFHGQHSSGELFNYLFGSPLGQIIAFYQHVSLAVPGAIFTIGSTLLLMGFWDPLLTAVMVVSVILSVAVMTYSYHQVTKLNLEYQKTEGGVSGLIADLLRGSRAVKLYALERKVSRDFQNQATMLSRMTYRRDVKTHMLWMVQETVGYFAFAALLGVAALRYTQGRVDEGMVASYLACFVGLWHPFDSLYQAVSLWGGAKASLTRIGEVMHAASSTPEPETDAVPPPERGELVFDRVCFRYEDGHPPILTEMNFSIPYGTRVALVGPSGAGKSTIAQLLLRLYDPQSGAIRLGGVDLRRMHGAELRRRYGVVPQDPYIFRTTIRENIRLLKPEASDEEIREACVQANAWEFIKDMPRGLDSSVGEGGSTLSGGQRQRLAIARVLLANPPFLLFDEATSALDTLSERLIQEALDRVASGRTALFIAHRLSTVKHCDRILVLREGRIDQDGTYDELVARPGLFQDLVRGQQLHG